MATLGDFREWIENLDGLDDDVIVVMSRDCEGNGFSPLSTLGEGLYDSESTWSGQVYPTLEEIEEDSYYSEEDRAPDTAVPCVVLWPTN